MKEDTETKGERMTPKRRTARDKELARAEEQPSKTAAVEIQPCPFCGGEAMPSTSQPSGERIVKCLTASCVEWLPEATRNTRAPVNPSYRPLEVNLDVVAIIRRQAKDHAHKLKLENGRSPLVIRLCDLECILARMEEQPIKPEPVNPWQTIDSLPSEGVVELWWDAVVRNECIHVVKMYEGYEKIVINGSTYTHWRKHVPPVEEKEAWKVAWDRLPKGNGPYKTLQDVLIGSEQFRVIHKYLNAGDSK